MARYFDEYPLLSGLHVGNIDTSGTSGLSYYTQKEADLKWLRDSIWWQRLMEGALRLQGYNPWINVPKPPNNASDESVRAFLPAQSLSTGLRSSAQIAVNTSTNWSRIIEWYFVGGLKTLVVQHAHTDPAETLYIGEGSTTNLNQPATWSNEVTAGQEWAYEAPATPKTVLARYGTTSGNARLIAERDD